MSYNVVVIAAKLIAAYKRIIVKKGLFEIDHSSSNSPA